MEPELRDLLRTVATEPIGESHTHVSLYGPHARWTIRPETQTAFWTGYCDLVDLKIHGRDGVPAEPLANLCLAERPIEVMPQIAKLTFRFQVDPTVDNDHWEPYDDDFLHLLCHTYQTVLSEYFRITAENQMELVAVVMESQTHWYEEDRENNQRFMLMEVRLQFPYARIDAGMQARLVRPRVIQLLRNNNVMAKMQRQPIGDWEQIISSTISNEPVPMYGSTEIPDRPKLELTHIWSYITHEMIEDGIQPDEIDLEDAFVPQNHSHVQQQAVSPEIFQPEDQGGQTLAYWLPMFLSLGYWPTVLLPKETVNNNGRFNNHLRLLNTQPGQTRVFGVGARPNEEIDESEMELAERMIPLMETSRFFREAFWLDIGKALYVSDEGGENGLRSWIHHTERALNGVTKIPDFMLTADDLAKPGERALGSVAETCRGLYYTFGTSAITVRTLAWYAREDSPERYATWHRDWCMSSMEQALSGYHTDVAIALHRVYWLDFVYCPIGTGKWFQFKNHRWVEMNQGIELRKAISKDFMKRFEHCRMVLSRQIHDSNDEAFKGNGEITIKKITDLIRKLKTVSFKSSIMTESCEHFVNNQFISLLDTNPELTGVINGVLEVSGHYVQFRKTKPEDYISMCTNTIYHENYTWNHPLVLKCMKWFSQVFAIDRTLLHHFLKFAASCLKGRNSDKIFPVFTGEGDNSKSMIVKLFEATFNSYCIKFDIANVTGRNANAAGPTPQLARAKATRIAFMDEPEDDVPMNKGVIKRWVGGDSFFSRMLNENGGDTAVTFKLVLTCNKVPIIPNADKAIKNRTRLFPFLSTWLKEGYPEDEAEQLRQRRFKMNPFFERDIPVMAPAFLWIMTQYYPYYSTEGLPDPTIVTETTQAYWRDNDVYAQFAADTIQEVYMENGDRDGGARVTLSEIYAEFKTWFRDAFPGTKVPERKIVKEELETRWGRLRGTAWHGIRIVTLDGPTDMTAALGGRKPTIIAEAAKITKAVVDGHPLKTAEMVVKHPVTAPALKPGLEDLTRPFTPKVLPKVVDLVDAKMAEIAPVKYTTFGLGDLPTITPLQQTLGIPPSTVTF